MKKDPFDGKDPKEIKQNILNLLIDDNYCVNIPDALKPVLQYILVKNEGERPTSGEVIKYLEEYRLK
jgi:hypothetical protein